MPSPSSSISVSEPIAFSVLSSSVHLDAGRRIERLRVPCIGPGERHGGSRLIGRTAVRERMPDGYALRRLIDEDARNEPRCQVARESAWRAKHRLARTDFSAGTRRSVILFLLRGQPGCPRALNANLQWRSPPGSPPLCEDKRMRRWIHQEACRLVGALRAAPGRASLQEHDRGPRPGRRARCPAPRRAGTRSSRCVPPEIDAEEHRPPRSAGPSRF